MPEDKYENTWQLRKAGFKKVLHHMENCNTCMYNSWPCAMDYRAYSRDSVRLYTEDVKNFGKCNKFKYCHHAARVWGEQVRKFNIPTTNIKYEYEHYLKQMEISKERSKNQPPIVVKNDGRVFDL